MRQTFKLESVVLAGWLSWLEHYPIHQKVVGLIPSQGVYLGCSFTHWSGCGREAADQCFSLTLMFLFLSLSKVNKHVIG